MSDFVDLDPDAAMRELEPILASRLARGLDRIARRASELCAKDTGDTAASIAAEPDPDDALLVHVGTDRLAGRMLEMGTKRMRKQPWLRPAVDQGLADLAETVRSGR